MGKKESEKKPALNWYICTTIVQDKTIRMRKKKKKNEERKKKKLVKSSPLKENNECDRMYVSKNTLLNKKQKFY